MTPYHTILPKDKHLYFCQLLELDFEMEGSAKVDPNTSSSEALKEALYGGYTRFELELEVPFHIDQISLPLLTFYTPSLFNPLQILTT